ncbi:hypothetical protein [Lysobacter sp. Root916]|uniref:hypothetical protein n=1 Tax=Lysobacter sp. Root916 TaxID=1736606 RepID=UPI0012FCA032|nr:hypothetical protein [Lysobacter sp. Root916]
MLVERTTLYVSLVRMAGCSAQAALEGFAKVSVPLPESARQTLTYDQGKEMALHRLLPQRTGLAICFVDPAQPWQRSIRELREQQWLATAVRTEGDRSVHLQPAPTGCHRQTAELSTRATLGYRCPAKTFKRHLGHHDLADRID